MNADTKMREAMSHLVDSRKKINYVMQGAFMHGWQEGVQAERERIRARAKIAAEKTWRAGDWYIGPQHANMERFVAELLEDGDE